MEKYGRPGQATDGNMAHCMLDTKGYKHTLRICNIYCFSSASAAYGQYEVVAYMYFTSTVITIILYQCIYAFIPV